jgi:hypothetical protein
MVALGRPYGSAVALALISVALFGCSSDSTSSGNGEDPVLEGELCVDPQNACCCTEEGLFVENTPSCIINSQGDTSMLTFELVRESGATVLPRLSSAAECTASGGWYIASNDGTTTRIELCEATCSIRRSETTRLRVLSGCPRTPC